MEATTGPTILHMIYLAFYTKEYLQWTSKLCKILDVSIILENKSQDIK
jgi:hypothetical protein